MTREEAKKMLMVVQVAYPNWHPVSITETIDAWFIFIEDYTYEEVMQAVKRFILTDTKGFAPSIGQIVACIHESHESDGMSELEAWSMVWKAICNSNYNSEAEFEKLPLAAQKAVGSPANLREWAQMETDTVFSVAQSHFIRGYRTALERQKLEEKLPNNLRIQNKKQDLIE